MEQNINNHSEANVVSIEKSQGNGTKTSIQTVRIDQIESSFDRNVNDEKIKGLAENIRQVGLINAISIKLIDGKEDRYRVAAGRRRFAALKLLNIQELRVGGEKPEIVIVDGDEDVIAFTENDERENLTLWEQVDKLAKLKDKFKTVETLAAELGKSPSWIAKRVNLMNLSGSWSEALKEHKFPFFSIGHFELVATFPNDTQDDILEYCRKYSFDQKISLRKFESEINKEFSTLLRNLPWNKDGSEQGCGECQACVERLNGGFLFETTSSRDARCFNRQYLQEKLDSYLAEEVKKAGNSVILVSELYNPHALSSTHFTQEEVLFSNDWNSSTKKDGGKKALCIDGPKAGQYIYVEVYETSNPKLEEKKVRSLEERKSLKERQRKRKAIDSLIEYIGSEEYSIPTCEVMFRLIACLGVKPCFDVHYNWEDHSVTYDYGIKPEIASYETVSNFKELPQAIWSSLSKEIIHALKAGQSGTQEPCWNEAKIISTIIGFDLSSALMDATKALPDPKSWKALEALEKGETTVA